MRRGTSSWEKRLQTPFAIEGVKEKSDGIGLLHICSRIEKEKVVKLSRGEDLLFHTPVSGYEIHMGQTTRRPSGKAFSASGNPGRTVPYPPTAWFLGAIFTAFLIPARFGSSFSKKLAAIKGIPFDDHRGPGGPVGGQKPKLRPGWPPTLRPIRMWKKLWPLWPTRHSLIRPGFCYEPQQALFRGGLCPHNIELRWCCFPDP